MASDFEKKHSDSTISINSSRRSFLKRVGTLGAASLVAPWIPRTLAADALALNPSTGRIMPGSTPIKHVVIACQENRSFDEYYGFAPFVGSYGLPPGWTQPDGHGGQVAPYHFGNSITPDIAHDWRSIHSEIDNGAMDGFYITDGNNCMGYYDSGDLGYYYSLFNDYTLCVNYFCSMPSDTFPNRLYMAAGTAGGNTTNNIGAGSLNYPNILDVLNYFKISFKVYNIPHFQSLLFGSNNAFQLFKRWKNDSRIHASQTDYMNDLANETFPQVAFVVPATLNSEHPLTNIQTGQAMQQGMIQALQNSSYWASSAYFLTYDEGGGYFDHVAPPVFDAYGAGVRVPMWVISPYAKKSNLQATAYEHCSTLKFLEKIFALPTLASVNHQFDQRTPGKNNDAANGQQYGPPAPPRDGLSFIGDLTECFNF